MSKQTINEDCWQLRSYETEEEFFSKENFTFLVAKRVLPIALLFARDAYYLFYYGKRIQNKGTYLEIGGALGGSVLCVYLATQTSNSSVNFITIDSFIPYKEGSWSKDDFLRNTKCISSLRLINSISDTAKNQIADSSIDLLFVDGNHEYDQMKRDLENYWPKLKPSGILLGHDYNAFHPGVVQATDEVLGKDKLTLLKNSSIFMVKK